jgi:hypothetical protein
MWTILGLFAKYMLIGLFLLRVRERGGGQIAFVSKQLKRLAIKERIV